jgi:S1-C subfamily serine protease
VARSLTRLAASALVIFLLVPSYSSAQPIAKQEIARRGKAATAFLIVTPAGSGTASGSGTAFCLSAKGLWVTNEHVIRTVPIDGKVDLIVSSNLSTQRVFKARVLRRDAANDLALLQSEGSDPLSTLPLGSTDKLEELADLYAFGFPFGKQLSVDKKDYPAISVNAGSVSALRTKDGKLETIEMDLGANPGHSGGPVLNAEGKVVGMIRSGLIGTKICRAIPVEKVRDLLQAPIVEFNPPTVRRQKLGEAVSFAAKVTFFDEGSSPPKVELIVSVGGREKVRERMKLEKGMYRVEAVPMASPKGPILLRARVRLGTGQLEGDLLDQEFRAGGKAYFLHDVRTIMGGAKPTLIFHDGSKLEQLPAELKKLTILLDEEKIPVNLVKAFDVQIMRQDRDPEVVCSVVVHREDREVARSSRSLPILDAQSTSGKPSAGNIREPDLAGPLITRTFPGEATQVVVGGGGRFLCLYIPRVNKAAIFDINEAKVIRYLDVPGSGAKLAAGQEHLLIALPEANKIQRWSLKTLELEATVSWEFAGKLHVFAMGSASMGPAIWITTTQANFRGNFGFLDPKTIKPLAIKRDSQELRYHWHPQYPPIIRVSGDGRVFGGHVEGLSPSGIESLIVEGSNLQRFHDHESGGFVIPSPDGTKIYIARHSRNRKNKRRLLPGID